MSLERPLEVIQYHGKSLNDCIQDSYEHSTTLMSITETVTVVGKETGPDDAAVGDTNEVLENHGEELSTED
jgi:hypothetical protein